MTMFFAAYCIALSAGYAVLATYSRPTAESLLLAFIAAIVVPACFAHVRKWRG